MAEALEIGTRIGGRYELTRLLGEGGMGVVWAARHVVTGKPVALKILKGSTEEQRKRFVQEARVAAAIRHPNVVEVHDVLELDDGRPILVMDLLEGEPLSEVIEREGAIAPRRLLPIALDVLAGLGAAHAAGVVHRDMKPENIFLCRSAAGEVSVKLLDFGIAKLTELSSAIRHTGALTQTGSVLGTPLYMAPEQVFGERSIDHRADFWSLGVVLYEGLTGHCPIEGDNVGQIFKSISQRNFPPIVQRMPTIEPPIAQLVDAMLAASPEDRPGSAAEIAQVLAAHLGVEVPFIEAPRWLPEARRSRYGVDPVGATLSRATRARPLGKGRVVWAGAAFLVVLVALGVALAWGPSPSAQGEVAGRESTREPAGTPSAAPAGDVRRSAPSEAVAEASSRPEASARAVANPEMSTASAGAPTPTPVRSPKARVAESASPAGAAKLDAAAPSTKPAAIGGIHAESPY